MERVAGKNRSAAVCYCLLTRDSNGEGLSELLTWCQDTFEKAGYSDVYQSFVVGGNILFAEPFKKYIKGFRAVLDEMDYGRNYPENLVLSYGTVKSFMKKNQRELHKEMEYYLILLTGKEEFERDDEGTPVKNKIILELKDSEKDPEAQLSVCSLAVNGGSYFDKNDDFIDAHGKDGIRSLISRSR